MSTNESFNSYPSQYPDKNSYSTSILNYPGRELVEKCISKVSSNIQDRINKITNKIKENQELSWDDREFLIMLYNFAVRIARYKGYMEAAELLERYLEASAEPLEISSEIYENSLRVQNEMYKQRSDIKKDLSDKKLQTVLRQSDLIYA